MGITVVAGVAAVALSSCGGSSDDAATGAPPSHPSSSPASTAATLLAVNARLTAETSYVVTTRTSDGLTSTEVHDDGAVSLDEHSRYGHRELVRTAHDAWVRIDNADVWRLEMEGSSAPAAAAGIDPASLVGHWVRVTGTRLATADAPQPAAPPLFLHPDDTTVTGHATVRGVDTVEYNDPVALTTVYLTTTADPLPVEVRSTANSTSSTAAYGEYGKAPAVQVPDAAGVIDGTAFLPT